MRARDLVRLLFLLAALYDGVLGAVFLLTPNWPFRVCGVAEPNHLAYVQFPGALLIIFALMFLTVAREPVEFRCLIPFGVLLKVAYCGLAFGYWFIEGIPGMWKTFAVADLVLGVLFAWAYAAMSRA